MSKNNETKVVNSDRLLRSSTLAKKSAILEATPKKTVVDNVKEGTSKEDAEKQRTSDVIRQFVNELPLIGEFFDITGKIGEGTFSSVFIGHCKADPDKKKYAIKYLVPTSHPTRIMQEFQCLEEIGGCDNVVGLESCIRQLSTVAFIMPYFAHCSFSEIVLDIDSEELKLYMRNLLIALKRVHSFGIIHRDIKPSNFLYNRNEKKFMLVDFGLAHKEVTMHKAVIPSLNELPDLHKPTKRILEPLENDLLIKRPALFCLSNIIPEKAYNTRDSTTKINYANCRKRTPMSKENSPLSKVPRPRIDITSVKRNLQFGNDVSKQLAETSGFTFVSKIGTAPPVFFPYGQEAKPAASPKFGEMAAPNFAGAQNSQVSQFSILRPGQNGRILAKPTRFVRKGPKECGCYNKAQVCNKCIMRNPMQAPRAGTPGYRAPEVLLRYPHQTTAVDMWSVGVIMLSIMSGSYPFFEAPDDMIALMEIITIFGTDVVKRVARKLGRNLVCSEHVKPMSLRKLCEYLRCRSEKERTGAAKTTKPVTSQGASEGKSDCARSNADEARAEADNSKRKYSKFYPDAAYDLLKRLLSIDPAYRISASQALNHPYLKDIEQKSDDFLFKMPVEARNDAAK